MGKQKVTKLEFATTRLGFEIDFTKAVCGIIFTYHWLLLCNELCTKFRRGLPLKPSIQIHGSPAWIFMILFGFGRFNSSCVWHCHGLVIIREIVSLTFTGLFPTWAPKEIFWLSFCQMMTTSFSKIMLISRHIQTCYCHIASFDISRSSFCQDLYLHQWWMLSFYVLDVKFPQPTYRCSIYFVERMRVS